MIKNIFKTSFLAVMTLLALSACDPQENDNHSLGAAPEASQLAFSATPKSNQPNVIELKNESSIKGVVTWDMGNGKTGKGEIVNAEYPFKGTYTISMTLYTTGGSATITKDVTVTGDDMSLLDTPMYNALTGGAANVNGKTWVFDQFHSGHFGVGPDKDDAGNKVTSPTWYSCPANGKLESSLYDQELSFVQVGVKLVWKNKGKVYTNAAGKNVLGGAATEPGAGDFDVEYMPKESYTYALDETNKTLTLNGDAFVGHFVGSSKYEILSLTEDELYLRAVSTVENGNAWYYRFIPKEKNVKPQVEVKVITLSEDFEKSKLSFEFTPESMGTLETVYSNPAPIGINTSKKVYLYEKPEEFYSNISWETSDAKFNLSDNNKIRMKVYIPSYNDYTKVAAVAGDWITVNKLQKQVAVKLQNTELGGDAWQTQTEIVKADLETDKWIELEFDFSGVKDRTDYNKIVIQFGAEGHAAPGLFFFDDFYFGK